MTNLTCILAAIGMGGHSNTDEAELLSPTLEPAGDCVSAGQGSTLHRKGRGRLCIGKLALHAHVWFCHSQCETGIFHSSQHHAFSDTSESIVLHTLLSPDEPKTVKQNFVKVQPRKQLQACSSESNFTVTTCRCNAGAKHRSRSKPRLRVMCLALRRAESTERKRWLLHATSLLGTQCPKQQQEMHPSGWHHYGDVAVPSCQISICAPPNRESTAHAHGGDSTAPHWHAETLLKNPVTHETDVACRLCLAIGDIDLIVASWSPWSYRSE